MIAGSPAHRRERDDPVLQRNEFRRKTEALIEKSFCSSLNYSLCVSSVMKELMI